MHEKKIASILGRLSKIVDSVSEVRCDNTSNNWRSFVRDTVQFRLFGENLDSYNKLLRELFNTEKWGEKFSEKYVDEVLQDTMATILQSGIEEATRNFACVCYEIETYSIQQTIYIPLGGIIMFDIEEIVLGKIRIKK